MAKVIVDLCKSRTFTLDGRHVYAYHSSVVMMTRPQVDTVRQEFDPWGIKMGMNVWAGMFNNLPFNTVKGIVGIKDRLGVDGNNGERTTWGHQYIDFLKTNGKDYGEFNKMRAWTQTSGDERPQIVTVLELPKKDVEMKDTASASKAGPVKDEH